MEAAEDQTLADSNLTLGCWGTQLIAIYMCLRPKGIPEDTESNFAIAAQHPPSCHSYICMGGGKVSGCPQRSLGITKTDNYSA